MRKYIERSKRRLFFFSLTLSLLVSIILAQNVFAGTHIYFSGQRSYGQLGISSYVSQLKGGESAVNCYFPACRVHNATQITPFYKIEAIGGSWVTLNHSVQSNKQNHCWWSSTFGYAPGTLQMDCHYYD